MFSAFASGALIGLVMTVLLVTSCSQRAPLVVAERKAALEVKVDPAQAVIVLPSKVDSVKRFAAEELQHHLELITGVCPPILSVGEKAVASNFVFYVGSRRPGDDLPFKPEEARYCVTPVAVYLYGDDTRRPVTEDLRAGVLDLQITRAGTFSAVSLFLGEVLGVRWLEPGAKGIAYTAQDALVMPLTQSAWWPVLAQRTLRMSNSGAAQGRTATFYPPKLMLSEAEVQAEILDGLVWLRRMRLGQNHKMNYRHAFGDWWDKYGTTNPEFFALTDRKKRAPIHQPNRIKMCVSSTGLVHEVVARWLREGGSRVNPEINVCENDGGYGFCQCDACRALDVSLPGEAFGTHLTDRYVHFANAVLTEARKHDPQVLVMFYAYSFFNMPPRRERLLPGVVPAIVPPFPLTAEDLRAFYGAWKRAGLTRCVLRPNDFHVDTGLPMGFEEALFDRLQVALEHGAEGIDQDSIHNHWACSGLAYYVQARAIAEPDKTFEHWEAEYCATFGAAQTVVRDYYRHWRNIWNTRVMQAHKELADSGAASNFRPMFHRNVSRYYSEADFNRTDALLQQALALKLDHSVRSRLENLLLANRHGRLTYRALASYHSRESLDDVKPEESVACAEELVRFRVAHQRDLRMVWASIFYREAISCFQPFVWQELFSQASSKVLLPLVWKGQLEGKGASTTGPAQSWADYAQWRDFRVDRFWQTARLAEICPTLTADEVATAKSVWYALNLRIPEGMRGAPLYLVFGGAGAECQVFVNGVEAGKQTPANDNWRGPFSIRIDQALSGKAEELIVIKASLRNNYGALYCPVWLMASK